MDFKDEFVRLKNLYPDDVCTGSDEVIDTDRLINLSENIIHHVFPASYKDFLREFCFAEIFGEEIFTLYPGYYEVDRPANVSFPGDITYNYLIDKKRSPEVELDLIAICHTGFDDELYFDYRHYHTDAFECDIVVQWPGGEPELYAGNYYEFLCKRINTYV